MDSKHTFKTYYSRLAKEGTIKSLVFGFIVGFSIAFIVAFVTFMVGFDGLWLSVGLGLSGVCAATPVFYYKIFRPKAKKIAERIDRLGLEERLITMLELEKDESFIAMRQREDAKEKLRTINSKDIKFSVFAVPIVIVAVLCVFATSMTVVSTLSARGLGSGWVPYPPWLENPVEYFEVNYVAEEGGYIEGEANQVLEYGEDAEPVMAVADDGYAFVGWSDGVSDPERTDLEITADFEVTAMFLKMEEGEGEPQEGDPNSPSDDDGEPGDPSEMTNNNGNDETPEPDDDPTGGGSSEDYNQVIDGTQYYRDLYDAALAEMKDIIAAGGEVPADLLALIEAYAKLLQ